jgi:hypothetical protein
MPDPGHDRRPEPHRRADRNRPRADACGIRTDDPGPGLNSSVLRSMERRCGSTTTPGRTGRSPLKASPILAGASTSCDSTGHYTLIYSGTTSDPWACAPPCSTARRQRRQSCTVGVCSGGVCVGGTAGLPAPDQCHDGTRSGTACSSVLRANGTPCSDGSATRSARLRSRIRGWFVPDLPGRCLPWPASPRSIALGRCSSARGAGRTSCDDGDLHCTDSVPGRHLRRRQSGGCSGGDVCHVAVRLRQGSAAPPIAATARRAATARVAAPRPAGVAAVSSIRSPDGRQPLHRRRLPSPACAPPLADGTPCTIGGVGGRVNATCVTGGPTSRWR